MKNLKSSKYLHIHKNVPVIPKVIDLKAWRNAATEIATVFGSRTSAKQIPKWNRLNLSVHATSVKKMHQLTRNISVPHVFRRHSISPQPEIKVLE